MAVGTTRPTLTAAWQAISDQQSVHITHEGGPTVELAIATTTPSDDTVYGSNFNYLDLPRYYQLAVGEEVYARCRNAQPNMAVITVMQSAYAG